MSKNELANLLALHLTVQVKDGDFTDPNNRTIVIKFGRDEICQADFNIVQRSEYEG